MGKLILIILFSGATLVCFGQTDSLINIKSSTDVCSSDPGMPSFPGGTQKLNEFINQNIQDSIIQPGTFGRVFVNLAIDTSGSIKKISILHGVNDAVDKEVLRVFSIMPKWIPAEKNGVKIEKGFVFPIKIDYTRIKK